MNGYARLAHVKADIANLPASMTNLDAIIARQIEETSREFDTECSGRRFYSKVETRYYRGQPNESGRTPYRYYPFDPDGGNYFVGLRTLQLEDDLLSASAMAIDMSRDNTFGTALVENTDYYLTPYNAAANNAPFRGLELLPTSTIAFWPTFSRAIRITGTFGYSNETETTGQTVQDALGIDASVTTITVTSTADFSIGDTLVLGTEQCDLTAVATPTTLTVTRGINGTTAAAHAKDVAIYRRRFPRDIEQVVKERVVGLRWDSQSGYSGEALSGEGLITHRATYARWRRVCDNYTNLAGVI